MDEGVVTTLPWRQATYQLYYILYISTTSRGTFFSSRLDHMGCLSIVGTDHPGRPIQNAGVIF